MLFESYVSSMKEINFLMYIHLCNLCPNYSSIIINTYHMWYNSTMQKCKITKIIFHEQLFIYQKEPHLADVGDPGLPIIIQDYNRSTLGYFKIMPPRHSYAFIAYVHFQCDGNEIFNTLKNLFMHSKNWHKHVMGQ